MRVADKLEELESDEEEEADQVAVASREMLKQLGVSQFRIAPLYEQARDSDEIGSEIISELIRASGVELAVIAAAVTRCE